MVHWAFLILAFSVGIATGAIAYQFMRAVSKVYQAIQDAAKGWCPT